MAGRWKLSDAGAYFDPNDSGPDQASPDQIAAAQGTDWSARTMVMPRGNTTGSQAIPRMDPSQAIPRMNPRTMDPSQAIPNSGVAGGMTGSGPTSTTGVPWTTTATPAGFDMSKWTDPTKFDPKYDVGHMVASGATNDQIQAYLAQKYPGWQITGQDLVRDPSGDVYDFRQGASATGGVGTPFWSYTGVGPSGSGGAGGAGGGAGGAGGAGGSTTGAGPVGGNVFTDPATSDWETLLRSLVDKLNQPQPTWTPAQLDLQQTQAIDPIERARVARKQQEAQLLASRGITPGSGMYDAAMRGIDTQFDTLSTQARSGFATQAIQRDDTLFGTNEQRATNAVNLMGEIPALADQRLAAAQGSLLKTDPTQLLSLENLINTNQYNAGLNQQTTQANFNSQLAQYLATLFGTGSGGIF